MSLLRHRVIWANQNKYAMRTIDYNRKRAEMANLIGLVLITIAVGIMEIQFIIRSRDRK